MFACEITITPGLPNLGDSIVFQWAVTRSHSSSPLPHISTSAPLSWALLWQRMLFEHWVFYFVAIVLIALVSFCVFAFASTCLVLFLEGFPSLYIYIQDIYIFSYQLDLSSSTLCTFTHRWQPRNWLLPISLFITSFIIWFTKGSLHRFTICGW
jgi:hypothetical protein